MRHSTTSAKHLLALLTITLALLIPATATAATYAFSIPAERIALSGFEAGAHPAFRHTANGIAATPGVTYPINAIARAWITLPAGGTFTSLSGTSLAGSGNNPANGMKTNVLIQAPDGRTQTIWNTILAPGYPTANWAAPAGFGASSIRLGLRSPKKSSCGTCATTLTQLAGTVNDDTPPAYVTLNSPRAGQATNDRSIPVSFGLRDNVAGPTEIHAIINGTPAGLLWAAGPADPTRLTHQRTAGNPVAAGNATITLPNADGTYTLQLHGKDAVGNTTASNQLTTTLDRTPPTLQLTAPAQWCSTPCTATITARDLTNISITARIGDAPVRVDKLAAPAGSLAATIDLVATGIQGTHTLTVTAIDALGHTTERSTTVQLDNQPPTLANLIADPETRTLTLTINDTSGLSTTHATVAGTQIKLAPKGDHETDGQTYTASIPATLGNLDGAKANLTATDRLGHTTTSQATFKKRSPTALTATTNRTTLTFGRKIRVTGALVAPELPASSQVQLRLARPAWPNHDQHLNATTDENGRFNIKLLPSHSGTLTATYHGTTAHQPITTTIAPIAVKPRIRVKFRGKRMRTGLTRRLRVRGTILPSDHPPLTLLWQAKPRGSKRWVTFCPDNNLITTTNGTIKGTCKLKGLNPNNKYRLALRPKPDSLYHRATSNARRARTVARR